LDPGAVVNDDRRMAPSGALGFVIGALFCVPVSRSSPARELVVRAVRGWPGVVKRDGQRLLHHAETRTVLDLDGSP